MHDVFRAAAATAAFMAATTAFAAAQSWNWTYANTGVQGASGLSAATLNLSPAQITTSNRIALSGRPDVVYGCAIKLGDVSRAIAVHTGPPSLLIQLKPGRSASCQMIGRTQSVVLRSDDVALLDRIAGAINSACCAVAAVPVTPKPLPPPAPSPPPAQRSKPPAAQSSAPVMSLEDWVETDGLFAFVRIRNTGNRPVTIAGGQIGDCSDVGKGCGTVTRRTTIPPSGVTTFATIAASAPRKEPSFSYRYAAEMGNYAFSGGGTSAKAPASDVPRMTQSDLRAAESGALAQRREPRQPRESHPASPPAAVREAGPRLVQAGVGEPVAGKSGVIQIRVRLGPDGSPQDAAVISSTNDALDDAGVEIAVSSTYAPAVHAGRAVAAEMVVTVSFAGGVPNVVPASAQTGRR